MDSKLKDKISKIRVVAMDVDGVLTDGRIIVDSAGKEIKNFDVQDGLGIVMLKRAGFRTAIITARNSSPVDFRARDLKYDKVYQAASPKLEFYKKMLCEFEVTDQEVCYIGDDLPDLTVLRQVGFSVSVPNAVEEIRREVDYVTHRYGGKGAVREVVDMILRAQGYWDQVLSTF